MRWGQRVGAPLTGDAPTVEYHSAQPTPNTASCALKRSANPACHSISKSTESPPRRIVNPRKTGKGPEGTRSMSTRVGDKGNDQL